jgi:pimeloyl-ACP methyl ester carboxylesterase
MKLIKNRKGQNISVLLELNSKKLAFIMHGLGGFKEQKHIQTFAEAFKEEGFSVVRFDTTNTLGESEGNYEDATVTNYYEDLEDVIEWAFTQDWYVEPFWLVGHSLGGICTALYAQNHPEKVQGLAPISTVVSGKISLGAPRYDGNDVLEKWEQTGWRTEASVSKPGFEKKLKWSHMVDRQRYDLLENVDKLTMPILMIVGDKDTSTPPKHQQILFDALPEPKEIHVITGASHTFKNEKELQQIKKIIKKWINLHSL